MVEKPSSTDVEQLMSASNKLKTSERARMLVKTKSYYLNILYIMLELVN